MTHGAGCRADCVNAAQGILEPLSWASGNLASDAAATTQKGIEAVWRPCSRQVACILHASCTSTPPRASCLARPSRASRLASAPCFAGRRRTVS